MTEIQDEIKGDNQTGTPVQTIVNFDNAGCVFNV